MTNSTNKKCSTILSQVDLNSYNIEYNHNKLVSLNINPNLFVIGQNFYEIKTSEIYNSFRLLVLCQHLSLYYQECAN